MKKLVLTFLLSLLTLSPAFAERTLIDITPLHKISTSQDEFLEGDYVDFKIVGTDKLIRGLIVKYQENGMAGKEAQLTIENFRALNSDEKYSGTVFLRGNLHDGAMFFFTDFANFVRGGEVKALPDKDVFSIWREE